MQKLLNDIETVMERDELVDIIFKNDDCSISLFDKEIISASRVKNTLNLEFASGFTEITVAKLEELENGVYLITTDQGCEITIRTNLHNLIIN